MYEYGISIKVTFPCGKEINSILLNVFANMKKHIDEEKCDICKEERRNVCLETRKANKEKNKK